MLNKKRVSYEGEEAFYNRVYTSAIRKTGRARFNCGRKSNNKRNNVAVAIVAIINLSSIEFLLRISAERVTKYNVMYVKNE